MYYYLTLTTKCNLKCKYCYGNSIEDFMTEEESKNYDLLIPNEINYNIDNLINLIKNDENSCITFYGGEPLLRIKKIKEIMDYVPCKRFMLQTNGIFLDKLEPKYLNKFSTILVSIDGNKIHTNKMRGKGVFEKIINNLNIIKKNGFSGEIIARMVVEPNEGSVYDNVLYLINNDKFKFTSIHWQIDAQFWKGDYEKKNFKEWSHSYNQDINKLIKWWIRDIEINKRVLKIYPFIGIIHDLYYNIKTPMRCGAGHSLYGIQPDGIITGCPITAGYKPLYCGNIRDEKIVIKTLNVGEPCSSCEVLDICGGRCLYANYTKLWGEKGFNEVCETTKFLINSLKKEIPKIKRFIELKIISEKDLKYDKYNGCEIIP